MVSEGLLNKNGSRMKDIVDAKLAIDEAADYFLWRLMQCDAKAYYLICYITKEMKIVGIGWF